MSDKYPLPSYAATIWTVGDRIRLSLPSPLDAPDHVVEFPATEKGLELALETLKARERSERSLTIGARGAPSQHQVERALADDKRMNEWLKEMGAAKAEKEREKAEAEAFLAEIGL